MVQILHSLGIPVKTPITVHVDNMGAIFIAENAASNQRTCHIDVRHCFLVDLTEEGFLDVMLTNSANNTSDQCSIILGRAKYVCMSYLAASACHLAGPARTPLDDNSDKSWRKIRFSKSFSRPQN